MADKTENQQKAAEMLTSMNEAGLGPIAHQIQEMLEEAWFEGKSAGQEEAISTIEASRREPLNPYMRLF